MSDPDNFLARWSRRKQAATEDARKDDTAADARDAEAAEESAADVTRQQPGAPPQEPPFDLASLPPVESITADTDIRAFFAPGVPAELTRAALRRAWSADPKIRDFVGLAENAWDFNNPSSIPGFGPLEMTPELRREVARIVGNLLPDEEALASDPVASQRAAPEAVPSSQAPAPARQIAAKPVADYQPDEIAGRLSVESDMQPVESVPREATARRNKEDAASQQQSPSQQNLQSSGRRGHGGALPK